MDNSGGTVLVVFLCALGAFWWVCAWDAWARSKQFRRGL